MDMQQLNALLSQLNVTDRYVGSSYVRHAVCLVVEHPDRLLRVTKDLYPAVAEHFNTTCPSVMRNIRTVIDVAWTVRRSTIQSLVPYPLVKKPTSAQFIGILAAQFMF